MNYVVQHFLLTHCSRCKMIRKTYFIETKKTSKSFDGFSIQVLSLWFQSRVLSLQGSLSMVPVKGSLSKVASLESSHSMVFSLQGSLSTVSLKGSHSKVLSLRVLSLRFSLKESLSKVLSLSFSLYRVLSVWSH